MTVTSQFFNMASSSKFLDVVLFLLSSLVTARSFMSISSLVLESWQFSFIRDWPEIRKLEIPPSGFCPIPGDYGELWITNLAKMSLIECYWMLQKCQGYSFYHFWVIKGKPTKGGGGGGVKITPPLSPTQIRVN